MKKNELLNGKVRGSNVLIRTFSSEKTEGGIYIPNDAKNMKALEATVTVVAIGSKVEELEVGDEVLVLADAAFVEILDIDDLAEGEKFFYTPESFIKIVA